MMIVADVLRAIAIGAIGLLSIAGVLQLWHVVALITVVGLGDALFNPASTAIVPDLVPDDELPQANALAGFVRPLMLRIAGPAVGGLRSTPWDPARRSWSMAPRSSSRPRWSPSWPRCLAPRGPPSRAASGARWRTSARGSPSCARTRGAGRPSSPRCSRCSPSTGRSRCSFPTS